MNTPERIGATQKEISVFALNLLNDYVNKAAQHEIDNVRKIQDLPVLKTDNTLKQKYHFEKFESVKKEVNGIHIIIHCYRDSTKYSHWLKFKVCVSGFNPDKNGVCTATYLDESVYIAQIDGDKLTKVQDFEPRRTDYKVHGIQVAANKIKALEEQISNLRYTIPSQLTAVFS